MVPDMMRRPGRSLAWVSADLAHRARLCPVGVVAGMGSSGSLCCWSTSTIGATRPPRTIAFKKLRSGQGTPPGGRGRRPVMPWVAVLDPGSAGRREGAGTH
jgi:hypothetical protein